MTQRDDQVEDWNAINAMWARRVKAHPMLEVEMRIHQEMLSRLDKELRGPEDGRPKFTDDLDAVMARRFKEIVEAGETRKGRR